GTVNKVEFLDGTGLLATTASPFTFTWPRPPAGSHTLTARATDDRGAVTTSAPVGITVAYSAGPLPSPWWETDVGPVGLAGSSNYSAGTFNVSGSGTTLGPPPDQFHLVYQQLSGDGQIVARVVSVQSTSTYAKAGVMIRETLDPRSAYAMMS